MKIRRIPAGLLTGLAMVLLCLVSPADAQVTGPATAPATAPAEDGVALGPRFESLAAGIALRPPAEFRQIRGALGSGEVVRFVSEQDKWALKVVRIILEPDKPLPLTTWKDKDGIERQGMLEFTTEQFKTDTPGAEILRQDTTNIGDATVGMMAARFNFGMETNLFQQAIIGASNVQYYLISMTTPAPRQGELSDDPGVQRAVETFSRVLDSVELLDQTALKEDQEDRLFRTRTLYVNLTRDKLGRALQNEQWLRIMRDGRDAGYTYVIEELAGDLPRRGKPEKQPQGPPEGVLVGMRTRMISDAAPGAQTDSEHWYYCAFDRKYEAWSSIAYGQDPKRGNITTGELGVSRWREKPIPDAGLDIGAKKGVSLTEEYRLEVTKLGPNVSSEPMVFALPPFYLPQALGHLLPRIVPPNQRKTYAFVSWVSDAGKLVFRYVDVEAEQEVSLGGKRIRAVPIKDRIGLEGSVTTHYVAADGKYLGSVNEETKVTVLPTDAATLEKIWKNANLTRPGAVDEK